MVLSAVEVFVERAFDALLKHAGIPEKLLPALAACVPDRTFQEVRTRDLWHALTAHRINEAPTWKAFNQGVQVRNRVVHAGQVVTPAAATATIDACVGLVGHMQDVMRPILRPDRG